MEEQYFLFNVDEDGDVTFKVIDPKIFLEELKDSELPCISSLKNLGNDPMYWGGPFNLIIKGKIVVPKAVEKIIKYEF
jgi:hypothetical protein